MKTINILEIACPSCKKKETLQVWCEASVHGVVSSESLSCDLDGDWIEKYPDVDFGDGPDVKRWPFRYMSMECQKCRYQEEFANCEESEAETKLFARIAALWKHQNRSRTAIQDVPKTRKADSKPEQP